ncbi:MAG: tRNA (adenosine(37)-N6)-dimethylallyltransferase MiaA [Croceivirga sp.]
MPKTVIAITGPTAIGKTGRAISLAQHFKTEIVSTDSRQFYKEMAIGTAVPSQEELNTCKHHFIQHISVQDAYSVGDFERDALKCINELFKQNDIVVLVGGSALFMDAVLHGMDSFPEVDPSIRKRLNAQYQSEGIVALQTQLKRLDPNHYDKVDLQNPHRLIRSLEVSIATGKPYSSFLGKRTQKRPFSSILIGLHAERELVYERINTRVDLMMEMGLLEEAKSLYIHKDLNALNTVGYKEIFEFLDGNTTLQTAVTEIKKNTRRFAKRQLTWYRKNKMVKWVPYHLKEKDFITAVTELLNENYG